MHTYKTENLRMLYCRTRLQDYKDKVSVKKFDCWPAY